MTTVLVTGATGRVGRHVVEGLRAAGVTVRALVRTPDLAGLPPDVELVQGDLYDPAAVRRAAADVDAAFLLWPSFSADGAEAVVGELPRRVVYLSSLNASAGGVWGEVEAVAAGRGQGLDVRAAGRVRGERAGLGPGVPRAATSSGCRIPEAGRSLIHERDIAAVAVLTLLDDQHIGQTYDLTGPEVLTQAEQVETIARAVGKQMRIEGLTAADARQAMLDQGADPALADSSVTYWSTLVDNPEPVTTTVTELTGRPALTFAELGAKNTPTSSASSPPPRSPTATSRPSPPAASTRPWRCRLPRSSA